MIFYRELYSTRNCQRNNNTFRGEEEEKKKTTEVTAASSLLPQTFAFTFTNITDHS